MSALPTADLAVIGGGINGAGIARDAAGRGLRVVLCEQHDLAGHTSSASTKLIHGGLRYLEHYEFGLVRKALLEREVLIRAAPHIIRPLRFVMPHVEGLRPAWMLRAGLFLYDHLDLGRRKLLPGSARVDLARHPAGAALRPELTVGFEYSDAWVEDARLVVLCALDARERGARVLTRTRCVAAERGAQGWRLVLEGRHGRREQLEARALVNATGPWVSDFLSAVAGRRRGRRIRQVKGSHIVVPALFEHRFAYIFQHGDGRVVFAIPYEGRFTLIGTTEVEWHDDPARAQASEAEIAYLCEAVSRYFRVPVRPGEVVHSFAGVRPLLDDEHADPSEISRDYLLDLDLDGAPLLSVFGGKITTFRRLAEEALERLAAPLGWSAPPWTEEAPLPGGDLPRADLGAFLAECRRRYPWLPERLRERLAQSYGTRLERLLGEARSLADLGEDLGGGLHEREVAYLVEQEWAREVDDVLWRRTRLGLHVGAETGERLAAWLAGETRSPSRAGGER